MSLRDGWAAVHLEMPPRVPRTEYSADRHWDLVRAVTGRRVDAQSPPDIQQEAASAFRLAWNYDLHWSTLISRQVFGEHRTRMGHAEYAAGGVDRSDEISCPFASPEEVLSFDPWQTLGAPDRRKAVRDFEDHYALNRGLYPDGVNMTGVYVTCISGLIELFGWEMLLLAAGVDSEAFGALTNRYVQWVSAYFEALAEAQVPVVMIHDDIVWTSGPFIAPAWYRRFVFPNLKRLLEPLRAAGKRILFTSDGTYTAFIDDLVACGVHGFVMEPTTDMASIVERYGKTHVIIGNADTRVLMSGNRRRIRAEVERCMALGKPCPGYFLAVGNHIPANTPVESALYYNEVYQELSRR